MDKNPFRTTLNPWAKYLLVFTGESSFQGFLGGAGFRPPTVVNLYVSVVTKWVWVFDAKQLIYLRLLKAPFVHGTRQIWRDP